MSTPILQVDQTKTPLTLDAENGHYKVVRLLQARHSRPIW